MSRTLFACAGGTLDLPGRELVLVDAADGGHLIVGPSRPVWERSELDAGELARWSFLVAATGRAMLELVPQLGGGCINYWEAGNWSLHDEAEPAGAKSPQLHRRVHLHLLGRSPRAASRALRWGEAPSFPDFAERHAWARWHRRLEPALCAAVVGRVSAILIGTYGFAAAELSPWAPCARCAYPMPSIERGATQVCPECAP